MFKLSDKSLDKMKGVNPALVAVVKKAIELTTVDFGVTEGLRSVERQNELFKAGKSQTMKSRHIVGEAVDVVAYVNGKVCWDWKYYEQIAIAMKQAAEELGIAIEWGGDWVNFRDGVHFQLEKKK